MLNKLIYPALFVVAIVVFVFTITGCVGSIKNLPIFI
jgi:hypothetical protein